MAAQTDKRLRVLAIGQAAGPFVFIVSPLCRAHWRAATGEDKHQLLKRAGWRMREVPRSAAAFKLAVDSYRGCADCASQVGKAPAVKMTDVRSVTWLDVAPGGAA